MHYGTAFSEQRYDVGTFGTLPFVKTIFCEETTTKDFGREYFVLFLDTRDNRIKVWYGRANNKIESGHGLKLSDIEKSLIEIDTMKDLQDFSLMSEYGEFFIAQVEFLNWLFGKRNIKKELSYLYDVCFLSYVNVHHVMKGQTKLLCKTPNLVKSRTDVLGKHITFDGLSYFRVYPNPHMIGFDNVNSGIIFKQVMKDGWFKRTINSIRAKLKVHKLKIHIIRQNYLY